MNETQPEVWSTDAGLWVEASANRLLLCGVARGEDTCVGLRLGGLTVELGLRPGLEAKDAVRLLLSALPEERRGQVFLDAGSAVNAAAAMELAAQVPPSVRHAFDAPV